MRMTVKTNHLSMMSKSNGCLMTLTPLACFLSIEEDLRIIDLLAREVAKITHN